MRFSSYDRFENREAATGSALQEKVFLEILQIHRKTLALESLFNNVTGLHAFSHVFSCEYCESFKNTQACNFIKESVGHRFLPVNFVKILRTRFLKKSSW